MYTHIVPATRVLTWVILSGKSLASPKSPILGWRFSSIRTLLALISRWTIGGSASSWRNARPAATPKHMAALLVQFNGTCFPLEPARVIVYVVYPCSWITSFPIVKADDLEKLANSNIKIWKHIISATWPYVTVLFMHELMQTRLLLSIYAFFVQTSIELCEKYLVKHLQGCYSPSIHTPIFYLNLRRNNQSTEQDLDVGYLKSY